MSRVPRNAYIVSHTHWDREWYRTFHVYRVWLCHTVRAVLDAIETSPDFRHFLLDGQAIILEDYLEIHPEDEPRIRAHVAAGRLSIGPWYILPDEFIVGAESLIRNGLIGHKVCGRFGGANPAGYMPDTFGHVAQMPQILRGLGLDSFIYWRGNGDEIDELGLEYLWQAPDGSEVLAIQQAGGYCNAASLGHHEIWHAHTRKRVDLDHASKRAGDLLRDLGGRSNTTVGLMNNGCDHFPPQRDFSAVLARLRADYPHVSFHHADLSAYLRAVRAELPSPRRFQGEMISGKQAHILSGVWSARMYLKQLNDRCQTLLAACLEPLAAAAHFLHGAEYPSGSIEYAWKLLLKNQPHDSICGCSIDEVHQEMLPRFRGVIDTAEETIIRQMEALTPEFARDDAGDRETVLCVANTLPLRRSAVIERLVILQPCCADISALRLIDARGREVPARIVELSHVERFWGVDYRLFLDVAPQLEQFDGYRRAFGPRILKDRIETPLTDRYVLLQFVAQDLPPVGHACFSWTDRPASGPALPPPEAVRVTGSTLENAFVRVSVHPNATFDLLHKASGRSYVGLNLLENIEDIGDEYDYSPCPATECITSEGLPGEVSVHRDTGFMGALEVRFSLSLPEEISPDRARRSARRVACPVRARISLTAMDPWVDIRLDFENHARDHRLRVRFPARIRSEHVWSDGHFLVNRRPIDRPDGATWAQPSPRTWPQQEFSLLQDGAGGLAVFNRGLPEIEPLRDDDGRVGLALTLLRCVGWLSRDDFPTRRCQNAGPTVPTPDAQCPGRHRFEYAVMPFAGDGLAAGVKHAALAWRTPPLVVQGVEDGLTPTSEGLVESSSRQLAITAIKKHERRDTLIIRMVNLSPSPAATELSFGRALRSARRTNLLEEPAGPELPISDRRLALTANPHEIVTLEIEFQ